MGKLAVIQTKSTEASVADFIAGLANPQQQKDSFTLVSMMERLSNEPAKMWGSSMIGFGIKRYKSPKTGREVDWFIIGFSPRKANLSLHLVVNLQEQAALLERLGKHKTGVGCLYLQTLEGIDLEVLEELIVVALEGK